MKNEKLENFEKNIELKKVAIIGLGVSNIPLIDYFYKNGAYVTVFDNRKEEELSEDIISKIENYNFKYIGGENNLKELKGFDIIFRSPSCLPTKMELEAEKKRGAIITSEIEMLMKLAPCKIIGVTGTEGKTTTSSIIYAILKQAGLTCYLGGNIGNPIFTKLSDVNENDIIVLEMSSFQLMDMEVSPNISLVTNIYPDHLNVHKDMDEYVDSKKNIFLHQNADDLVVLNYDNEITRSFEKDAKGNVTLFSSKEKLQNGYIYDKDSGNIVFCKNGIRTNIIHKSEIKLRGIHNYENICAALAVTASLVDTKTQVEAIKEFIGVEHRLEFVREIDGVKYYNDSIGTSPASTIAGLNAFDENIVLLAGGSDKGLDYTEIGEKIAEKVGTLILCGPTSKIIEDAVNEALKNRNTMSNDNYDLQNLDLSSNDNAEIDDKSQFNGNLKKHINIIHVNNMQEAVLKAKENAKSGDIVLLSPASASFDLYKNFAERGKVFKEFVNKI